MKYFYGFILYLILGLWLMISPYALGFTDMPSAYWNAMVVGLLSVISAIIGLYYSRGEETRKTMMPHAQRA
jgi:hypothetical protein